MSNNLQSIPALFPRIRLLRTIQQALEEFPVVALLGARQVGKTTLAHQIMSRSNETVTLYDLATQVSSTALFATPELLLRNSEGLVIIDEIQRQPNLFSLLKPICEDTNRRARFLLLGSASPDLIQNTSDVLVGRIRTIDVSGFSIDEMGTENQMRLWLRGGFPRSYLSKDDRSAHHWLEVFTRTYLERDVLSLDPRTTPSFVDRFLRMLAHRHGYTWNASEIGDSLGVRQREVKHIRDLLLGSYMIRLLPAWVENLGKRLIKSPKIYLRDSGILHHSLCLSTFSELSHHPSYGSSWHGFALEQIICAHGDHDAYYYRTQRGTQLDLLLLRNGKRWGFQFSCSDAPRTTKSMHIAIKDLNLSHLWVIYPSEQPYPLTETVTVLPLGHVGSLKF